MSLIDSEVKPTTDDALPIMPTATMSAAGAVAGVTSFNPVLQVRTKVIPLAASNGTNAPPVTGESVAVQFKVVNEIWRQAGIQFLFDPSVDMLPVVKNDAIASDATGHPGRLAIAKQHPDSLVLFVRNVGGGFSGGTAAYAAVGNGFEGSHVAHEIGHYLHLAHTYGPARAIQAKGRDANGQVTAWDLDADGQKIRSAEELIRERVLALAQAATQGGPAVGMIPNDIVQRGLEALDGDNVGLQPITDTPPHFWTWELDASATNQVSSDPNSRIAITVRFNAAHTHTYYWQTDYNVMSYWHHVTYQSNGQTRYRATLSPQQVDRARSVLTKGNRYRIVKRPAPMPAGPVWAGWEMVDETVWSHHAPALAPLRDYLYLFWTSTYDSHPPTSHSSPDNTPSRSFGMSLVDGPEYILRFEVQGGGITNRAPASASVGDFIWVLARGVDDRQVYSNYARWQEPFRGWALVGNGMRTEYAPAVAALGNVLYAVAVRSEDSSIQISRGPVGSTWGNWVEVQGGYRSGAAPAAASLAGRLNLFVRGFGSDRSIYVTSAAEGQPFNGWSPLPGGIQTDRAPAATALGDQLYVFASRAADHTIVFSRATVGHAFDGQWRPIPLPTGVVPMTAPAAATFDGRIYLAVVGSDRRLYLNWSL